MQQLNLKPTHKLVKNYYEALGQFGQLNIDHEMAVRSAFQSQDLRVRLTGPTELSRAFIDSRAIRSATCKRACSLAGANPILCQKHSRISESFSRNCLYSRPVLYSFSVLISKVNFVISRKRTATGLYLAQYLSERFVVGQVQRFWKYFPLCH